MGDSEEYSVLMLPGSFGKVVVSTEDECNDGEFGDWFVHRVSDNVWLKLKHGIFTVWRYFCHVLDTIANEKDKIAQIIRACEGMGLKYRYLQDDADFGMSVDYLNAVAIEQISALAGARDTDKKNAIGSLHLNLIFRDVGNGSFSRMDLELRDVEAVRLLANRLDKSLCMQVWMEYHRSVVWNYIMELENVLEEIRTILLSMRDMVASGCESHTGRPTKHYRNPDKKILISLCKRMQKLVWALKVKPYAHLWRRLHEEAQAMFFKAKKWNKGNDSMVFDMSNLIDRSLASVELMRCRRYLEVCRMYLYRLQTGNHHNMALHDAVMKCLCEIVNDRLPTIISCEAMENLDCATQVRDVLKHAIALFRDKKANINDELYKRALLYVDSAMAAI
ncbi:MAG: hypothetical protein ABH832_02520 [bacterium]